MGENNCAWTRKPMLHRDTITAAAAIYKGLISPVQMLFQITNTCDLNINVSTACDIFYPSDEYLL